MALAPNPTRPCWPVRASRTPSAQVTRVSARPSGPWRWEGKKEYAGGSRFLCVWDRWGQEDGRGHTRHARAMGSGWSQRPEREGGGGRLLRLALRLSAGAHHPPAASRQRVWCGESRVIRGALTLGRMWPRRRATLPVTQPSLRVAPMLVPHFRRFPGSSVELNCPFRPLKRRY